MASGPATRSRIAARSRSDDELDAKPEHRCVLHVRAPTPGQGAGPFSPEEIRMPRIAVHGVLLLLLIPLAMVTGRAQEPIVTFRGEDRPLDALAADAEP